MVSDTQGVRVQHNTFVVKQSFLQWLHKRSNPRLVVNLCFIVVLIFSTLLTWREVVVLEDAYISSQRNHLETVASALDSSASIKCCFFATACVMRWKRRWRLACYMMR